MEKIRNLGRAVGLGRLFDPAVAFVVLLILAVIPGIPLASAQPKSDPTISVFALPLQYVNRDPSNVLRADIHANISYTLAPRYTPHPVLGNSDLTPFHLSANESTYLSFCVNITPAGWEFLQMWGVRVPDNYGVQSNFPQRNASDYIHFPRQHESCLLNQRAIADLKIVMFFTQASQQSAVSIRTISRASAPGLSVANPFATPLQTQDLPQYGLRVSISDDDIEA